ncbi:hypothetical protein JCM14469_22670 [Desulfatiferula olefinivorans]
MHTVQRAGRTLVIPILVLFAAAAVQAADYEIHTLTDLQAVTPDHLADRCILMNDIDASETAGWNEGRGFEPIGMLNGAPVSPFTGQFVGNGHRITGLTIRRDQNTVGLFSVIGMGAGDVVICDLTLADVDVSGLMHVGALAGGVDMMGEAGASIEISGCSVLSGTVASSGTTPETAVGAGGLVGTVQGFGDAGTYLVVPADVRLTIHDCETACTVTGGDAVGGLLGWAQGNGTTADVLSFFRNTSRGAITGSNAAVGGLVGLLVHGTLADSQGVGAVTGMNLAGGAVGLMSGLSSVRRCSAEGPVAVTGNEAGGLVGRVELNAAVTNCFSTGAVSGGSTVGGFVGANAGSITTCYSTGTVTGADPMGGFIGSYGGTLAANVCDLSATGLISEPQTGITVLTAAQMREPAGYPGWDFTAVWAMETAPGHETLPFFRFRGGSGTADDPYRIGDVYGLEGISHGATLSYRLVDDVDASVTALWNGGTGFSPLPFNGRLDGQGFAIRSLYADRSLFDEPAGLFGTLEANALIENLMLEDARVIGGESHPAGLLAGSSRGTLLHCAVSGRVSGADETGGLIGTQLDGHIAFCSAEGVVMGGDAVGGLAGAVSGGRIEHGVTRVEVHGMTAVGGLAGSERNTEVTRCSSRGTVNGYQSVGGLIGHDGDGLSMISQCFFQGEVTGSLGTGGLIGQAMGTLSACYCSGQVRGDIETGGLVGRLQGRAGDCMSTMAVDGRSRLGGLTATLASTGRITRCYSAGTVSGDAVTGGLVALSLAGPDGTRDSFWDFAASGLTASDGGEGEDSVAMRKRETFDNGVDRLWDFDTIWAIAEDRTRPVPLWDLKAADLAMAPDQTADPMSGRTRRQAGMTLTNLGPHGAVAVTVTAVGESWREPCVSMDGGQTWTAVDGSVQIPALDGGESIRLLFRDDGADGIPDPDARIRVDANGHDPDLSNNIGAFDRADTPVYGGDGSGCFIGSLND